MLILQLTESSLIQFYTAVTITKGSKQWLYHHFIWEMLTVVILPHPDNKIENAILQKKKILSSRIGCNKGIIY